MLEFFKNFFLSDKPDFVFCLPSVSKLAYVQYGSDFMSRLKGQAKSDIKKETLFLRFKGKTECMLPSTPLPIEV